MGSLGSDIGLSVIITLHILLIFTLTLAIHLLNAKVLVLQLQTEFWRLSVFA